MQSASKEMLAHSFSSLIVLRSALAQLYNRVADADEPVGKELEPDVELRTRIDCWFSSSDT